MDNTDLPRVYIVFRKDLPDMTRAKGEIQAAHAVAGLMYKVMTNPKYGKVNPIDHWMANDLQLKVLMEVPDRVGIEEIRKRAEQRLVNYVVIEDRGYTVFKEPTVTCIAVGPCTKTNGNMILRGAEMRA